MFYFGCLCLVMFVGVPVFSVRGQSDDDNAGAALNGGVHKCDKDNGYEWERRTGSCYKFHRVAKTWREALSTCHAEGGYLAIINSETESIVLKELCQKNPIELITGASEPKHAFVGFMKYYDDEWATIYGDLLATTGFTGWDENEPNNYNGNEACGSIHRNGRLNDATCGSTSPFICESTP